MCGKGDVSYQATDFPCKLLAPAILFFCKYISYLITPYDAYGVNSCSDSQIHIL